MNPHIKIALAIKTGRTALGWNQKEFAHLMGVSTPMVARTETMVSECKLTFFYKALDLFKANGVHIALGDDSFELKIMTVVLDKFLVNNNDRTKKSSDYQGKDK